MLKPEPELLYPLGLAGIPRQLKSEVLADKLLELDELFKLGLLLGNEMRGGGRRNGLGFTLVGPLAFAELLKFISELEEVSMNVCVGVMAVEDAEGKYPR